jgi:pimeloyl-ACP methyl ester carboxylesterase
LNPEAGLAQPIHAVTAWLGLHGRPLNKQAGSLYSHCMKSWALAIIFSLLSVAALADGMGKQSIQFDNWEGPSIPVFLSVPAKLDAQTPVVFVMHGVGRNADEYRDQWHELAQKHGFLLAVPGFSKTDFPGADAYNLGNTLGESGDLVPQQDWSFSVLEPLFDQLQIDYSLQAESYALYGHSAGGQFVHRLAMHLPQSRVHSYVPANAGWYTLPDFTVDFPYGLKGSQVSESDLRAALQLPLTILLGDRDIDPDSRNLRHNEIVDSQGLNRLARGLHFFEAGRQAAAQRNIPFKWHIATVRGVDHDNSLMAPAAIPFLLQDQAAIEFHSGSSSSEQ